MDRQKISQTRISAGAMEAAVRVAHCLGTGHVDPIILHESQHISVRLFPMDVVARVVRVEEAGIARKLHRELAVTRHLVEKRAPVVSPTTELPAGPHFHDGYGLTLWQFVNHVPADGDNREHAVSAAAALSRVHEALADIRDELPSFLIKIDQCRLLLENDSKLAPLRMADRTFLLTIYNRIRDELETVPIKKVPIHGDAHLGNVFITSDGVRWNDLDDVCIGPREWDIGWLPDIALAAFEPVNRNVLSVLHYLRSLCVSVWCWDKYDLPEKREAAEYHLSYLRQRFG
jgi:Ser/Thr protein kinase RdoA (MazF antagonist)